MRLISVRHDERRWFAGLLLLALAQSGAALITAWTVKELFDRFTGRHHHVGSSTGVLVTVFVATALAGTVVEGAKRRAAAEMSLRRSQSVRLELFRHLVAHPHLAAQRAKGGLLLPFVGDLTALRRWVGEGLAGAASAVILMPVILAAIMVRDGILGAALLVILLVSFGCSVLLLPALDRAVRDVRGRRGGLTNFIIGRLEAASTIYVSGRKGAETRKVRARIDALSAAERWRSIVLGATSGVAALTRSALVLCTVVLGFHEARAGRITVGSVAGILTLVHLLSSAVTDLVRAFEDYRPAKVAYERIDRILSGGMAEAIPEQHTRGARAGDSFRVYNVSNPGQLQRVSAEASRGSVVLIEGPPGSGKSSLLRAIAQLDPLAKGTISFEGRDLRAEDERSRARLIGYASTDLALLPGSLGMNLGVRSKLSDYELARLARGCGLNKLIARMPGGLKGRLSGRQDLSVGERQGIALARSLAGNPPLLLLDSVDSNLDAQTLEWLGEQLADYSGIVLMTATTERLRSAATVIWKMADGRLIREQCGDGSSPRAGAVLPLRGRT